MTQGPTPTGISDSAVTELLLGFEVAEV